LLDIAKGSNRFDEGGDITTLILRYKYTGVLCGDKI
jgi:hypothetical protein